MRGRPDAVRSSRRRRGLVRLALGVLVVSIVVGSLAGDGSARAAQAKKPDPIGHLKQQVNKCKRKGGGGAVTNTACDVGGAVAGMSDPSVTAEAAGRAVRQLGANGQVDPITGLGIRNPVCDKPGEIRDRTTQIGCRSSGTPEGIYPASNYGFDIFIDTGIDAPSGTFVKGFVFMLDGIWLGLIFVLKLILSLLGIAFGLNPFSDGETMRGITRGIHGFYSGLTQPWLDALIVFLGIGFAWKGLVKRELAASVGGVLASIALLLVGMWVINRPSETVGAARRRLRPGRPRGDLRPAGRRLPADRLLRGGDVCRPGRGWSRCPSRASTSPTCAGRWARRRRRRSRRPARPTARTSGCRRCSGSPPRRAAAARSWRASASASRGG